MKIVLATSIYPPEVGRPAAYIEELARRLAREHDVTIVAYSDAPSDDARLMRVSKRHPRWRRSLHYFVAVSRAARSADLIYVQNAMSAGLPVALVNLLRGTPYLVKFWGDEAWERACQRHLTTKPLEDFLVHPEGGSTIRLMMAVEQFVLRRAAIVTTSSAHVQGMLVRAYGLYPERVVVHPVPADRPELLPFEAVREPHRIAYTPRLATATDRIAVENAHTLIQQTYPDATLAIGEHISKAEAWHIARSASVSLAYSTYDATPYAILRSFAAGTPVIAADVNGVSEIVHDGETGLLVPQGDAVALARAISRVFEDGSLARRLAENGAKILAKRFSWEAHLGELRELFRSVLSGPRHIT
ncbi:MAG: glycosyltransferase family 4 protein [bacterium]|nr:glycosyltransferase family 4 protein [bacterium]